MKKWLSFLMALTLALGMTSFASAEQVETIEAAYMLTMNAAEQRDMVQEELNRLLDEKGAGFHVNLVCIDFASWSTQVNLMLTDGSVDLFNCSFMPAMSVLADSGSLAPLDDLLATYGQGILDALGDNIECARIGGVIYGTPKIDAFSSTQLFFMSKEIADEVGIDPDTIVDYATLTEALKQVKAVYPDMTMIANGNGGAYFNIVGLDYLGTESPLGCLVLEGGDGSLQVVNGYETDIFKEMLDYAKQWNELGFFMKDPLNAQDGAFAYLSNGQAFGTFGQYCTEEVGRSVQEKGNGMELYACQLMPQAYSTTNNVTAMTWCVPALSPRKESAVKFLNLLYTDADIANLLCNGIEGVHYVVTEEGNIDFPEGLDAFNTGWPSGMGTFWPNITITYPWKPDPADVYQSWLDSNATCMKSPALGFTFDPTNVADEISACSTIVDKYVNSLLLDVGDTETLYAEFLSDLEAAGMDAIIAEKQAQLDAWQSAQ